MNEKKIDDIVMDLIEKDSCKREPVNGNYFLVKSMEHYKKAEDLKQYDLVKSLGHRQVGLYYEDIYNSLNGN